MARGVENDIADLMARLRRVNSNGDATPVLAPEAMAAVCRIILSAPSDPDRLVGVASLLIAWHLARAQVVGDGADVTAAVELRALMARLDRSEVPPEWLPVAIEQVAQRPNAALHPAPASGPALLVGAVQFQGNALFDQVIEVLRLASRTAGDAEGTVVVAANLASALQARYRRTGDQTDLAEAIGAARRGVAVESASAEARAMCLLNLATVLAKSFEATQRLEELSEAVERNRAALAETRVDDPMHSACGYNLALLLRMRYLTTRTVDDLEEALTLLRAVIAAPSSGQYLAHAHHERSVMLGEQFEHTHDPGEVEEAVVAGNAAVAVTAQHDPELPKRLSALGDALERRFELRRDPGDEDQALALRREAARQAPTDARVLAQLAECLRARYQRTSEPTWLAEALHVAREAVAHSPATGDEAADSHNLLGNLLDDQFDATSDPSHLAGAAAYRSAVEKMPPGDPDYAVALVNAGRAVLELGKVTRATERLDEAVVIARAARRAADVANPGLRMQALVLVAHTHEESHSRTGCPQVAAELAGILDELRTRLNAPDVGDLQALLRLADVLLASPARSGRPADLDLVIEISERVKADPGVSAALQGEAWRCLCQALRLRANHTGSPADLAAAVRAGRQVTAATPEGHPAQVDALAALSVALIERASRTGSTSDAEEAVHFGRQAARLANARQEAAVLANLASALQLLYVYTERLGALSESIEVNRRAVALLADGAADRASLMNNLGSALLSRHQRMGNPDDLDAAIEVARSAVAATASRGVRAQALHNLASALTSGYESVRDPAMLDEIVRVNREAVECTDPDHAGRAGRLVSLGRSVRRRFESGGAEADLAEAMTALREALAVAGASPATRASAALELADLAGARENWIGAVEGYAVAIGLLPRIAWLGIERSNREDWLRHLGGVGSAGAAAALTLGDPRRAIELLEQGRTVLWNQDLLLRDERSALAEGAPELNETLDSLAAQLNADERPNDMVPIAAPEYGGWRFVSTERRQTLAGQWEATLDQVRALPGFGDFLTIPPADVLQRGVGPHPVVVVNVHPRRSDAIIVTGESATALPLPDLRYREVERRAEAYLIAAFRFGLAGTIRPLDLISAEQTLLATLEWLWDVLAEPVLAALGHDAPPTGPDWPRVVWCPTGLLALLPLHAAGYHDPEDRASGRAVLDRVISSHTPSLRALARGCDGRPGEQEMLVVAVPDAEGLPDLPGARAEAYALIRDFPHLVKESLVDSAATRDAVTRGLAAGRSVHFACHGSQQVDAPASGAVHLADDTLTIADIAALRLDRAEFAYLSACQTAVGGAELPDEAIHLAAALQLAGYRRVIGTLWTINDQTSVGVARQVYELMLTPSGQLDFVSSATALHHAVRDMRAAGAHARLWAPYVHFGP